MANWLRACGVKKGSAVGIYLPMIAELAIAVLACARIGAVRTRRCEKLSHIGTGTGSSLATSECACICMHV